MKRSKVNLALGIVTAAIIVSVTGSLTGTLAWYAYATRAVLSFTGTSAYASQRLRVGIHDSNHYLLNANNIASLRANDALEIDEAHDIIWGQEGEGLTGTVISQYLDASPYATKDLPPITTLSRELNSQITTFYKAPLALNTDLHEAPVKSYSVLPLCFKVVGSDNKNLKNQSVWLTGISVINVPRTPTEQPKDLAPALRIYVENKYAIDHADDNDSTNIYNDHRYFLIKATDTSATVGDTVMAGTLDLKGDGTYDYAYDATRHGYYEVVYGDYGQYQDTTIVPQYNTDAYVVPEEEQNYQLDDVNGTGKTVASTFLAKHADNVFTAKFGTGGIDRKKALHDTISTIAPVTSSETGHYIDWSGKPVARTEDVADETANNADLIAYCNLTFYLEGWDHAIIDEVISASFNLGLQFEVDRL